MSNPSAYPLRWPSGWPKTRKEDREPGKQFQMSLEGALKSLRIEVERLGGTALILSSNYTLGVNNPADPGVVAYFTYDKAQVAIPCDRWAKIEANVRAIALTIEAMRGMERWGAKHMIKAMFTGFKALMPGSSPAQPWHVVLDCPEDSDYATVHDRYKKTAKLAHPDNGGSDKRMSEINVAFEEAKIARGWK